MDEKQALEQEIARLRSDRPLTADEMVEVLTAAIVIRAGEIEAEAMGEKRASHETKENEHV